MLNALPFSKIPLLLDAPLALLIFLLSGAIGLRVLRRFRLAGISQIERGLFAFTLGLGIVSYLPFVLFALHIGKPVVVAGVFLLLSVVFAKDQLLVVRYFIGQVRNIGQLPAQTKVFGAVFLPLIFVTFLQALCPPTDPDGLHYHLTAPQFYLREGRFFYAPTFLHLNWPLGIEMLFAIGMAFHTHFAAGLIQFGLGLVLLCAVYQLARRLNPDDAQKQSFSLLGFITIALSFPFLRGEMTWAYIDLGLGLYTTLAGYALLCSWELIQNKREIHEISPYWTLAAVCAGLATTAKLPGLFTIILVAAMIWGQSRAVVHPSKSFGVVVRPALSGLLVGTLVSLPWFVRSWAQTRTPIYPYFGGLLGVVDWSPEFQARLNEYLQMFVTLPSQHLTSTQVVQLRTITCIVLLVLGSIVCLLPKLRTGRPLLFYVFALTFLQVATSGIYLRYFLPYLPLMILLTFWSICGSMESKPVRAVILLLICLWLWGLHKLPSRMQAEIAALSQAGKVAVGSISRDEYLTSQLPGYAMARWCNTHLPSDAVLFLGIYDAHASLFERRTLATHYWLQNAVRYDSDMQMRADLKRLGVTHLLIDDTPAAPMAAPEANKEGNVRDRIEFAKLKRLAEEQGTLRHREEHYVLYILNW